MRAVLGGMGMGVGMGRRKGPSALLRGGKWEVGMAVAMGMGMGERGRSMRWGGSFVDRKAEEWRIVKVRCKGGERVKPPRDRQKRCGGGQGVSRGGGFGWYAC